MSLVQRLLWILTEHSEFSPHVGRRKSEEETGHTPVLLSQLSPPRVYTEVAVMECSGPFVNCLVSGLGPREGPWSPLSAACRTDVPSHLSSLLDKLHSCKLGMWYNIWQSTYFNKFNNNLNNNKLDLCLQSSHSYLTPQTDIRNMLFVLSYIFPFLDVRFI